VHALMTPGNAQFRLHFSARMRAREARSLPLPSRVSRFIICTRSRVSYASARVTIGERITCFSALLPDFLRYSTRRNRTCYFEESLVHRISTRTLSQGVVRPYVDTREPAMFSICTQWRIYKRGRKRERERASIVERTKENAWCDQ